MAEHPRDIHIKRFNHKEVNVVKIPGDIIFPLAEGNLKQPGTDVKRSKKSSLNLDPKSGRNHRPSRKRTNLTNTTTTGPEETLSKNLKTPTNKTFGLSPMIC